MSRPLLFPPLLLFLVVSASAHGGHYDDNSNSDIKYSPLEKPNLMRPWSFILVNILCQILVFVGGILPYFLRLNEGFLVRGTKFATTVFLVTDRTVLVHILTHAKKNPLFSFMVTSCGYLVVMFAGGVISYIYGKQTNTNGGSNTPTVDLQLQGLIFFDLFIFPCIMYEFTDPGHMLQHIYIYAGNVAEGGNLNGQYHEYFLALEDSLPLIFALCFHSVFEGIATGVAGDTKAAGDVWTICFQKIFAAVAMGIALLRMIPDRPLSSYIAYALTFAISSPTGVSIGILIHATTQASVADWIYSISIHLAYGAFLFISINRLLSKGYGPQPPVAVDKPYHNFLALLLAIGIMTVNI
ncbi:zinc transporter 11-like [Ipomoea triloba]|uniref:zinc transporter 11-like n=1 Tax=Ipomoea triloba TaxID=35885 RepID=UPI00125DF408|nr:zinc transporter 11-like [Ipomoea triloba]